MELQVEGHLLSLMEHWHTVELCKDLAYLLLLRLLNEKAWPTDPFSFHDWMALLQVEKVVIEDGFGGFDTELVGFFVFLDDDGEFECDYD